LIRKVSLFLAIALLGTFCSAGAQQTTPPTFLDKQLSRLDLGISGAALFNKTVSGTVDPKGNGAPNEGSIVSDDPSNTAGALVSIRYVAKPLVGFEFNYLYARYTENFSYPPPNFGVQTQGDEFSLGYVVTPKFTLLGLQPFASVGAGTTEFKPTAHGGQSLPKQARMTYYYSVGVQKDLLPNFGLRASFRQTFFLAPDYLTNYLTILQHTTAYEPNIGFYFRF
jgi:hypothetical protein